MTPEIIWKEGDYPGDERNVAMVGKIAIGAIFLNRGRGARYTRWRVWHTANSNPVEGTAKSDEAAKKEVEKRFYQFLMLAGIISEEEWLDCEKA